MKRYKVVIVAWAVLLILAVVFTAYSFWPTVNILPKPVRNEITFSPFVLASESTRVSASNYALSKAEDGTQMLTYDIAYEGGEVTVSQYPQPSQFVEIPEYKDRFLTNVAKQYATVQTANGTIYLGRMEKQDNKQLAVMLERGLIVFMRPDKELNDATWRAIGDAMEIQRIL